MEDALALGPEVDLVETAGDRVLLQSEGRHCEGVDGVAFRRHLQAHERVDRNDHGIVDRQAAQLALGELIVGDRQHVDGDRLGHAEAGVILAARIGHVPRPLAGR